MATSIPSSMSFEMLSRLPANSFVLVWKEIRPDQQPQGNAYTLGQRQRIRFVLRGAPNEFLMNTNMYLCGNAYLKLKATDLTNAGEITDEDLAQFATTPNSVLNSPFHFFQSSRESFNAGALPYLDNQDIVRSHEINNLRYASAQRNRSLGGSHLDDLNSGFASLANVLSSNYKTSDFQSEVAPVRLLYNDGANVVARSFGKDLSFKIPLGLYSNFVNSHSVIPVGLTTSYAVNGWQIEVETSEQAGRVGVCYQVSNTFPKVGAPGVALDAPVGVMKDVRIYCPMIRVLDPSAMEAILSLYEKREQVNIGGVQFPLSLRINSIAYRTASFPLFQNQSDYYFRITGTDRSVRAVAWWVYKRSQNAAGNWSLIGGQEMKLTRLETMIGTEHVHEVVEDVDNTTNNVSNFISVNARRSQCLFSPLPYYQEGREFQGLQNDDTDPHNNVLSNYIINENNKFAIRNSVCYGYVSLENLDRREADYSGSFQASGKDLTGVGAIEMRMRFQQPVAPVVTGASTINALDNWSYVAPVANDYEVVFVYAYDSVMEVSPQGVQDITNAVL